MTNTTKHTRQKPFQVEHDGEVSNFDMTDLDRLWSTAYLEGFREAMDRLGFCNPNAAVAAQ